MLSARTLVLLVLIPALTLIPAPISAGIPRDGTFVLGFHIRQTSETETLPLPRTPDALVTTAAEPGNYDVWLFLFSRAPLIGAWSLSVSLLYDGVENSGVDVLNSEMFLDEFNPQSGWPASGVGMFGRWHRFRCMDPERFLLKGDAGWWLQPVGRFLVRVSGPDRITFGEPEPGVAPQLVECFDEEHDLDGTDSWSRVIPAVFGDPGANSTRPAGPSAPSASATWGGIKARHGSRP